MKFFEGLEWAMGFQWPVIAVFLVLLVIGIERMISFGSQEPSRYAPPAGIQKKRHGRAGRAEKLAGGERHFANRVKAGLKKGNRMHQTLHKKANRA